jgi:hypothetical protein
MMVNINWSNMLNFLLHYFKTRKSYQYRYFKYRYIGIRYLLIDFLIQFDSFSMSMGTLLGATAIPLAVRF